MMATNLPITLMVLGVVSNKGDARPPHTFAKGLKINSEVYVNIIKEAVKLRMDVVAAGCHYLFQWGACSQQQGHPALKQEEPPRVLTEGGPTQQH